MPTYTAQDTASAIQFFGSLAARIRAKLIDFGLGASEDKLQDSTDQIEAIVNRGAVSATLSDKNTPCTIPAGYHNGSGSVGLGSIDAANLIPGNIRSGVNILGVQGSMADAEEIQLQSKSVTPSESSQTINPDSGYDGLSQVNVGAIPSNYKDISATTAAAGDVLATRVFVGADGVQKTGSMPNNGTANTTIDGLVVVEASIAAGYHDGNGKVSLDGSIAAAIYEITGLPPQS